MRYVKELASRFQRRCRLKMLTDGGRTTDTCIYYKLTFMYELKPKSYDETMKRARGFKYQHCEPDLQQQKKLKVCNFGY